MESFEDWPMCENEWCNESGVEGPHYNMDWCRYGSNVVDTMTSPDYDPSKIYFGACKGKYECEGHICIFCHDPFYVKQNLECISHAERHFRPKPMKPSAKKCMYCTAMSVRERMCGECFNIKQKEEQEEKEIREALIAKKMNRPEYKRLAAAVEEEYYAERLVENVDLEWWLDTHGSEELPTKYMVKDYYYVVIWNVEEADELVIQSSIPDKREITELSMKLKELDGTIVGGTHVWKCTGRKHFKREGPQTQFRMVPLEEFENM